jgi:outer membrane protein TolC
MKKILFLLFVSAQVFGQNVDYNKIILPEGVQSPDFAEKLVQLAWKNHPSNQVFRSEVTIAEIEVRKAAGSWLDIINVTGNLNEFNINPESDQNDRAAFYPKYNIRGSVSLGMFFTIPYTTKQNRQRVMIAESNLNAQKLETRNLVMKSYNEYVLREKVFKIQSQLLSDTENTHKLNEQKFKNGEATFETFSLSLDTYNRVSISFLEAERDYKNSKLDLEKLIGMKLEDVR